MSNLTDFFSAGGAGGGIGQTITVGDISYPNARSISDIKIFYQYNNSNTSDMTYDYSGFNSTDPDVYHTNGSGSLSDWVTVADITSSLNGGALYGAYCWHRHANKDHTGRIVEMRITIDGTATTFTTSAQNAYNFNMAFLSPLGKIVLHHKDNSVSSSSATGMLDPNFGIVEQDDGKLIGWSYDATNDGYLASAGGGRGQVRVAPVNPAMFTASAYPFVYFSSTCKVEMKVNRDDGIDKHYAYIRLF